MSSEQSVATSGRIHDVRTGLPVRIVERTSPPPPPPPPDIQPLVEAVQARRAELDRELQQRLGEWEQACVELCVDAVERLLGRELTAAPAELAATLRAIATESRGLLEETAVVVRAHPREAELLRQTLLEDATLRGFELKADDAIEPGDLQVETGHTRIVHRLTDELRRVQQGWRRELSP